MREIKFRAWDTDNDKFIDCSNHTLSQINNNYAGLGNRFIYNQYTGLKDKNGKEIYEGDITFHHRHEIKCNIIWINKYSCFCGETIDEHINGEYNFYQEIDCDALEVIGNIYENQLD